MRSHLQECETAADNGTYCWSLKAPLYVDEVEELSGIRSGQFGIVTLAAEFILREERDPNDNGR